MTLSAAATARDALALTAAAGLLFLSGGGRTSDPAVQPQASTAPEPRGSSATWSGTQDAPRAAGEASDHLQASASSEDLEAGRRILSRHCGSCHTPGLPTTKAGALAIFSLADADWTAHMTPKQICASGRRLTGTSHEPGEVRAYTELIGRLLAQRGAPPCGS